MSGTLHNLGYKMSAGWGEGGVDLLSQHITISRLCRKFLISSRNLLLPLRIKLMVKNLEVTDITPLSAVGDVRLFHIDILFTGRPFVTIAFRSDQIWNVPVVRGMLSLSEYLQAVAHPAAVCISLFSSLFQSATLQLWSGSELRDVTHF